MPVVLATSHPTFTRDATYYKPSGAGFDAFLFKLHFNVLPGRELKDLRDRFFTGDITQDDVLEKVVHGWSGLKDAAGVEVPYSVAERKATEEDNPGFEQAIAVAWFDSVAPHQRDAAAALAKEATKNSEAQSSTTTV